MIVDEKDLMRARNAAFRYLASRPRSTAEVEAKLRSRGVAQRTIGTVLSDLVRLGYINDKKFAGQWAESRMRVRLFGKRRIERELIDRGVERDVVQEELSGVFAPGLEQETARKAAEKKLRTLTISAPEIRKRRLAGFLERQGFSFEVIRTVLREVV